jgi:hypothetical protein
MSLARKERRVRRESQSRRLRSLARRDTAWHDSTYCKYDGKKSNQAT